MSEHWQREWVAALDELEADVTRVEAMLAADHRARDHPVNDPWHPPDGLGPLPLSLKPRADAILARQIAATQAIAVSLVANRRQAAMMDRIETGDPHTARPAYVDCAM
jgi:hypothetical protein